MHLHKSFKAQKCKTQLGLAMSRMKVLRNKKANAVNQMKSEVAQLLKSDQDQQARIRVEHVIREEKIMGAYDLLDLYCELLVTRLQMIETQKICPIDLKEAISSVIFASPRCADIPELSLICKQFSAKYGKDFVNSALELRPNCGVTSLLVEKLSAKTPDIETKVKVLTSIASENGIKWEPKSFEESLQRPNVQGFENSFERSSNFTVDTSKTEAASQISQRHQSVKSTTADKMMTSAASVSFATKLQGPTSFESASEFARESTKPDFISQRSQKHEVEKDPFVNDVENSLKSSDSTSAGSTNAKVMQPDKPKRTASRMEETGHEEQEIDTYSREGITVAHQEKRGMVFKDATSAAEAAAESAERASMAARAAAQLAGVENDSMQYHTCDERKPKVPESLKFKSKSSFQEQVQMPSNETEEMQRKNSGSVDQCKGGMNDRSGIAYFSGGTGKDISRRISSSSMRFNIHSETAENNQDKEESRMSVVHKESEIETRYDSHSHDSKRSVEGTEKAHGLEGTLGSDSGQGSFDGESGPTFDEDNLYDDDYKNFDNFGNNEESPFQNQGSSSSDFPSYPKPCPPQQKSNSISNDNSSMRTHSMKKSYADKNTDNTREGSLPWPSLDILSPSYDSDPAEREEVDCIDLLSRQTENDSIHSENLDCSNDETEQVSKIEKLPVDLNRGFPRPPYTLNSEKPLASIETPTIASSRIKKADHSISYFESGEEHYDQELNRKHVFRETSRASSSDSDSSEVENLQPNDSPTISQKKKFDPRTRKTSRESLYERTRKQTSKEFLRATVLNSGPKTEARKVNASLLLHKTSGDISPGTVAAVRHEMPPNSESSTKWEVLDEESRVRESDSRQSIRDSGPSNGDGEDSQSYGSYGRSGSKNIIKHSRRTRGPSKNANVVFLSKSPERAEPPVIQRKSQEDILDKSRNSKLLPGKSQGRITSASSEAVLSFGTKQPTKRGTNSVSKFQPPTSWEKNMSDEDFESSSQDTNEDSESFRMNSGQTSYPRRTQRTNSPASTSSWYSRKASPLTSLPGDSLQPSNLEKETPKSTTSTSRGELERNLSIENKEKVKHIHPKLPDSDKLLAHFQALRSNVQK